MKTEDIKAGGIYYDGSMGVREVVSIAPGSLVSYLTHTLKAVQKPETVVTEGTCDLVNFSEWASKQVDDAYLALTEAAARNLHLSSDEIAFMKLFRGDLLGIPVTRFTTPFSIELADLGRRVEKLGLVTIEVNSESGNAVLTDLGLAWTQGSLTEC